MLALKPQADGSVAALGVNAEHLHLFLLVPHVGVVAVVAEENHLGSEHADLVDDVEVLLLEGLHFLQLIGAVEAVHVDVVVLGSGVDLAQLLVKVETYHSFVLVGFQLLVVVSWVSSLGVPLAVEEEKVSSGVTSNQNALLVQVEEAGKLCLNVNLKHCLRAFIFSTL